MHQRHALRSAIDELNPSRQRVLAKGPDGMDAQAIIAHQDISHT
jgi:hypothetical protein